MSFGAGHVQDMNYRIKQNRAQRPSNRPKFKENNREGIYSTDKKTEPLNFKTVPEKELIEIKKRIRNRAENQRKKEQLIFGIFIFCGLISIIGILLWLN
jgi:(p)ppGpp synthase/HD superfamily hydrolase